MHETPIAKLLDLSGKVAVVTGGAMGIGFGVARRLAEAGAKVAIVDRDEEAGQAAAAALRAAGREAAFVRADVGVEADAEAAVAFAAATFGGVDVLVNNAGIFPNAPALSMDAATFDRILGVNLRGVFLFTRAAAKAMVAAGRGGRIVNVTSVDAIHPSGVGLAAYDASKHGVWGFTKNVALELAPHRIWVNAVAPGSITTPGASAFSDDEEGARFRAAFLAKIPMGRSGDADEIGRAVLFLASDLASYVTGSQLVVDGGLLLS